MARLCRTALLLLTGLLGATVPACSQSSSLAEGQWYKIAVEKDGLYEITWDQLRKNGIDPAQLNPTAIQLFTYPAGMLPQSNSAPRAVGLQEVRFYITGAADGRFNRGDKLIFFGQGPDVLGYDRSRDFFKYENNLYSDRNFYFLTFNQGFGKTVGTQTSLTTGQITYTYNDLYLYDTDKANLLQSGREWFGLDFDANTIATLEWTMDNTVQGSAVKIATRLLASAYDPAGFRLQYDNKDIADYPIASIPATPYGLKGRTRSDTAEATVASGTTHRLRFEYVRGGGNYSIGRLDQVLASVKRKLIYKGKNFLFFNTDSNSPECMLEIERTGSMLVWDVTHPLNVANQEIITFGNRFRFTTNAAAGTVRRFAVFDSLETLAAPTWVGKVNNQDLSGTTKADFVIVTHPNFLPQAHRLAAHRREHNGLRVSVATTEQIFNEFSGGRQDVVAIRDYLRYVFETGGHNLRHVLLFGRGSFDYRNLTTGNTNYVPTYQSRNSLSPLETWSSDDFYAFLEPSEGNWGESPAELHTLDIGVGRIPCVTAGEAQIAVDKLIAYDLNPATRGNWRKELLFVADDGDNNIHQSQAETLAEDISNSSPELHVKKLYVDAFEQQQKSFGQLVPAGTETLRRALHDGAVIVNYTGHGSEQLWAAERLLDPDLVRSLRNRNRQPFLVTATCEFGRCDDPNIRSSAELFLFNGNGGAIGLVTTSRPVSSATNFQLNKDFYGALFSRDQRNQYLSIGSVFKATKNARNSGIANRNFALLGDPSMRLGLPEASAVITSISNEGGQPVMEGLGATTIHGEIKFGTTRWTDYNGVIRAEIFLPASEETTLGNENQPFPYQSFNRSLWKGEAEISKGLFTLNLRLPAHLTEVPVEGKFILHATSSSGLLDAGGSFSPLAISPVNRTLTDDALPTVQLFINDSTFLPGGTVNKDPIVLAYLADDTGIDLSGLNGRPIQLTLDDDSVFVVQDYAVEMLSTNSRTELRFPFFNLKEGRHVVKLEAYDLSGQLVEAIMEFVVSSEEIQISEVNGFPNPMTTTTSIRFRHTLPGDDLEGALAITDHSGRIVREFSFRTFISNAQTEILEWDGTDRDGNRLPPGIYFLRVDARSLQNGAKNRVFGKLVLLN